MNEPKILEWIPDIIIGVGMSIAAFLAKFNFNRINRDIEKIKDHQENYVKKEDIIPILNRIEEKIDNTNRRIDLLYRHD